MKTAGNILSALFDEGFVKKANGYSKLFNSWADITAKNGIAAAADHSRIKDLDRGILLIEMDHPGWKQILQTKQSKLLNDFRYRFPQMDITGIALMLAKDEPGSKQTEEETKRDIIPKEQTATASLQEREEKEQQQKSEPLVKGYDAIKDDDFKEKLKNLGQTIADREKG